MSVPFLIYPEPAINSLLQTGQTLWLERARAQVTVGRRLGGGSQGVVHEATLNGAPFAVKWIHRSSRVGTFRESINALVERGQAPHPAFVWPIDIVTSEEISGFGYLMRLLESRFVPLAQVLNSEEQPSFRATSTLGRELAEAFAALHSSGLCYRDISFGNIRVDPRAAQVAIIDVDNIGADGSETFVRGTMPFMAPEIVRGEALPSTTTDLHSLAVLLFWLFVHGHPLVGARTDQTLTWDQVRHVSDGEIATQTYGLDPIFVFHPANPANRPLAEDPMIRWWRLYPRFLQDLFTKAFTTGLRDPSLSGRVTEGTWRRALLSLHDLVVACPRCQAAAFYDPQHATTCWDCGSPIDAPAFLELPGGRLALSVDAALTHHHLYRDRDHHTVLGLVEPHPGRSGQLVLRNMSGAPWTVHPEGEQAKPVAPGQRLAIRPMSIRFDSHTRGLIK